MHVQTDVKDGPVGGCGRVARAEWWRSPGRGRCAVSAPVFAARQLWVRGVCRSSWCWLFVHLWSGACIPQVVARPPAPQVATHVYSGEQTPLSLPSKAILSRPTRIYELTGHTRLQVHQTFLLVDGLVLGDQPGSSFCQDWIRRAYRAFFGLWCSHDLQPASCSICPAARFYSPAGYFPCGGAAWRTYTSGMKHCWPNHQRIGKD